jgi:hypothetical protein
MISVPVEKPTYAHTELNVLEKIQESSNTLVDIMNTVKMNASKEELIKRSNHFKQQLNQVIYSIDHTLTRSNNLDKKVKNLVREFHTLKEFLNDTMVCTREEYKYSQVRILSPFNGNSVAFSIEFLEANKYGSRKFTTSITFYTNTSQVQKCTGKFDTSALSQAVRHLQFDSLADKNQVVHDLWHQVLYHGLIDVYSESYGNATFHEFITNMNREVSFVGLKFSK